MQNSMLASGTGVRARSKDRQTKTHFGLDGIESSGEKMNFLIRQLRKNLPNVSEVRTELSFDSKTYRIRYKVWNRGVSSERDVSFTAEFLADSRAEHLFDFLHADVIAATDYLKSLYRDWLCEYCGTENSLPEQHCSNCDELNTQQ